VLGITYNLDLGKSGSLPLFADRFGLPNRGTAHFSFMNIYKLLKQHVGPTVITCHLLVNVTVMLAVVKVAMAFQGLWAVWMVATFH